MFKRGPGEAAYRMFKRGPGDSGAAYRMFKRDPGSSEAAYRIFKKNSNLPAAYRIFKKVCHTSYVNLPLLWPWLDLAWDIYSKRTAYSLSGERTKKLSTRRPLFYQNSELLLLYTCIAGFGFNKEKLLPKQIVIDGRPNFAEIWEKQNKDSGPLIVFIPDFGEPARLSSLIFRPSQLIPHQLRTGCLKRTGTLQWRTECSKGREQKEAGPVWWKRGASPFGWEEGRRYSIVVPCKNGKWRRRKTTKQKKSESRARNEGRFTVSYTA